MFDKVIKGGMLVDCYGKETADLAIEGKFIAARGRNLSGHDEIDAEGCIVMPGAIDPHVHVSLDFRCAVSGDDWDSITRAAAWGGVTTIIDFDSNPFDKAAKASGRAWIDYSMHCQLNSWDGDESIIRDAIEGGVTSFKVFTAYGDRGLRTYSQGLKRLLELSRKLGFIVGVHAEDDDIARHKTELLKSNGDVGLAMLADSRPPSSELSSVGSVLAIAYDVGGKVYIAHASCGETAYLIDYYRGKGLNVFCETCPHYLLLDDSALASDSARFAVVPPLRPLKHKDSLWNALASGKIDWLGTDHCPFSREQRMCRGDDITSAPCGLSGVETMVPLALSEIGIVGGMEWERLSALLSANSAKAFGLWPRKGSLSLGADADISVWNIKESRIIDVKSLHSVTDMHPFDGWEINASIRSLLLRGSPLIRDAVWVSEKASGNFIARKC